MNKMQYYKGGWIGDNAATDKKLSPDECKHILDMGGYYLQNTYNFDKKEPSSFWFVIKDSFGGMEELSSKKRNQVRKSLRCYDFKMIDADVLKLKGLEVENKARKKYAVKSAEVSREDFEKRIDKETEMGCFEYWGIFVKDTKTLVGFSINRIRPEYVAYAIVKVDPDYFGNTYPFYGLFYKMNEYYLEEKKYAFVNDGRRSLTNHSNVQPFLIDTFHFRKAYCDLQVEYVWWLRILVNILYPFRKFMPFKIKSFLNMEAMKRNDI